MNKKKNIIASLTVAALLVTTLSGCQPSTKEAANQSIPTLVSQTNFASYREVPVDVNPLIKAYRVSDDLSNVTNKDRFAFSVEAQDYLIKNGFVVIPTNMEEFFTAYEMNRYDLTPNFITTDAMLHNYHLFFNYLLRTLEKDNLSNELHALTKSMLEKSQKQYDSLKGTDWENSAIRNVAFFAVAAKLLNPETVIPSYVREEVNVEYQLITDHQETFIPSPVMNIGHTNSELTEILNEDYTQYIPRGHYTKSDDLKTYFKTMMWYGRMTFRASNTDETKSAALLTLLLSNQNDYNHWNNIYEPTNFFVGKSDDLGFTQYYPLLKDVYGKIPTLEDLTANTKQWDTFLSEIEKLNPPVINSLPIYDEIIQPDREEVIKGFRFMGQRFTLDAAIFQRLIYREVGENSSKERRMLPKGLDIPAAMGSQEAYSILKEMGETSYTNYPENMKKLQDKIASLDVGTQTQNLYWSWLYTLSPLTEPKEEGYPFFMQNQGWTRKQLETYLGSWTELKHDTVLYAKQVYAEMGGGGEDQDDRGYVEPNPAVYGRLASLTRMTIDGLQSRGLLDENITASLEQLEELSLRLKTISEKELAEQPLSDEEYDLIRSFGGQLEHFWLEALKDEGVDSPSAVVENPAALITDVATDPNGQVLEEATGYVSDIYVVVPVAGTLRIAKGAVYSYYEFPWPSDDRLTNEKWKDMLENSKVPSSPSWTKTYTAPKGSSKW
ncbi:MAG: DUF3160 domain-containing protein [Anaerovorax sp.]|nr:DUF3160 domain-containing protein [Anaerovorax sp.]